MKQNQGDTGSLSILKDWEALDVLNELYLSKKLDCDEIQVDNEKLKSFFNRAIKVLKDKIADYDLPFELPEVIPLGLIASCPD